MQKRLAKCQVRYLYRIGSKPLSKTYQDKFERMRRTAIQYHEPIWVSGGKNDVLNCWLDLGTTNRRGECHQYESGDFRHCHKLGWMMSVFGRHIELWNAEANPMLPVSVLICTLFHMLSSKSHPIRYLTMDEVLELYTVAVKFDSVDLT